MDLPINAEVTCADGAGGQTTCIVLNPVTKKVTHIVVQQSGLTGAQLLVPLEDVVETTPHSVKLRITRDELSKLPSFIQSEFVKPDDMSDEAYAEMLASEARVAYPPDGLALWPYAEPMAYGSMVGMEAVPKGELAVRRGHRVMATDGHVGQVDEFLINPETDEISHLVMREGHFWGKKDVAIPLAQIERVADDAVYLKLNKKQVQELPAVPVRR